MYMLVLLEHGGSACSIAWADVLMVHNLLPVEYLPINFLAWLGCRCCGALYQRDV
jgi:hypothetical protein